MAFLSGAKNVREASSAADNVARFTFDLNGPGFATYIRDAMTEQLANQGKLPPGTVLELSRLG